MSSGSVGTTSTSGSKTASGGSVLVHSPTADWFCGDGNKNKDRFERFEHDEQKMGACLSMTNRK